MNRMERLTACRLYGIVDLGYIPEDQLIPVPKKLLAGGLGILQLRAKHHAPEHIERMGRQLAPLCRAYGCLFLIKDHTDVARSIGADGVHLGTEDRKLEAARRLLDARRRGRYADAAQLPSELELADVLGVSRTVVRDALSDLERDGYVERVRGIGTLVNRDVVQVENRMDQKLEFNRMIRSIGRVPHSDNLMVTRETARPELAAKLGLDPEREHTLVFVRRRVLADETPVLYSTDILPLALFGGKRLDTIDFSRPIFEIVEQHCHVEVTETLTTLQAVQGVPGIRRQLGLRPEQALLQLDEICYSRTCKPVLCCQTCYTDFFDFAMVRKLI